MCKKVLKYVENHEIPFKTLQNTVREFEIFHQINHPCICQVIEIKRFIRVMFLIIWSIKVKIWSI